MRASHLIRELQKAIELFGDLPVETEGCDCRADSYRLSLEEFRRFGRESEKAIWVRRPHDRDEDEAPEYDNAADTPRPLEGPKDEPEAPIPEWIQNLTPEEAKKLTSGIMVKGHPLTTEARLLGQMVVRYGRQTDDRHFEVDLEVNMLEVAEGIIIDPMDEETTRIRVGTVFPLRQVNSSGAPRFVVVPAKPREPIANYNQARREALRRLQETQAGKGAELRHLIAEMRKKAVPVGPLHSFWDIIFDAEAFLEGKKTILEKTLEEWCDYCRETLEGPK